MRLFIYSLLRRRLPGSTLFPYTTLFRSRVLVPDLVTTLTTEPELRPYSASKVLVRTRNSWMQSGQGCRSEEHTSELQSRFDLVCRLLLEKKKCFCRRQFATFPDHAHTDL